MKIVSAGTGESKLTARKLRMKEIEDLDLKTEIDQISKKIDAIVQRFEELAPIRKEDACPKQE
ncbi:MAG: hypothetical protein HZB87_05415 [Desulfatitalea sp.]|nr:hypothetical protein [Desulfatitalea sp.]